MDGQAGVDTLLSGAAKVRGDSRRIREAETGDGTDEIKEPMNQTIHQSDDEMFQTTGKSTVVAKGSRSSRMKGRGQEIQAGRLYL